MALATVEQLRKYMRRAAFTAVETAAAELLLDVASAEVVDYCGWHIAPTLTETVMVDGSAAEVQPLPTLWLLGLISVTDDGEPVDLAEVEWSRDGYLRRTCGLWTRKLRGVEAQIEHGYPEAPLAAVGVVCEMVKPGMANPAGVVREQSGGESVTHGSRDGVALGVEMTDWAKRILDRRYRIANPA